MNLIMQISGSMAIYYFTYVVGKESLFSVYQAFAGIAEISGLVLLPILTKKIGREDVFKFGSILPIAGFLLLFVAGIVAPQNALFIGMAGAILKLGSGFLLGSTTIMLADVVDYGEFKLGTRNESIVFSVQTLLVKGASAVAGWLVGVGLSLVGYVAGEAQSATTILGMRVIMIWKKRRYALEDRIAELEKEIQRLKDEIADASGEDAQAANEENAGASGEDVQTQEDLEHAKTEETGMEGADTGDTQEKGNADKNREKTGEDAADKKALLAEKESELEACRAELTELERNPVSQPDYSAEESEYDAWQQTKSNLEDAVQAAKHALEDAKLARESTLREKRRALASAEVTASADATIGIYNMDIAALQGEIADLNDVKSSQGCVTAKADGYVLEILVATGQRTTDTAAMLLADTTSEYMFRFGITKEQSKYVQLGDSVELSLNSADHKKVTVTADYIEENTAGGYDVTCRLGDAKAPIGSYGVAKRTVQGEMYPSAVPIDAILEENKVYYLFTVNEKTGILGKEYYVERLKVNVVDQNDRYAAIEGAAIGADTQIVISSSKELKQGESVRLQE